MQSARSILLAVSVGAVVGLLVLNWRAQVQTQQKLDALTAALAELRPEVVPPVPFAKPVLEPGTALKELNRGAPPPYVIDAPDQLLIEVVVKDPKTGATDRLPTQPISGSFVVRPDGTVGLGFWGSVSVAGLTLEQATATVRDHVAKSADKAITGNLSVVVNTLAQNSKRYYVVTQLPGTGEQVAAFPLTGSETVRDAITKIGGLLERGGKPSVRLVRKGSNGAADQTITVDWDGTTQHGVTAAHYPIQSGDRIYVTRAAD